MKYNSLKEQSFIYKQELRKKYKDGFTIRMAYSNSEKFNLTNANVWDDFNIKLAKAITISYEQLLKDYLDHPSKTYELEYPEFKEIVKYLKESEMNTLDWNKEKMMKRVSDKKIMDKVYMNIHQVGFISNTDLKNLFKKEFDRLGIDMKAKASLIENCTLYDVKVMIKKIDGKNVRGYKIGEIKFNFKI